MTAVPYSVYSLTDGRIHRFGECSGATFLSQADANDPDQAVFARKPPTNDAEYYVGDGEMQPRPMVTNTAEATIAGNGVDEFFIGNVPPGTLVELNGLIVGEANDGEIRFRHYEQGEHFLRIMPPFPWQQQLIRVTVT